MHHDFLWIEATTETTQRFKLLELGAMSQQSRRDMQCNRTDGACLQFSASQFGKKRVVNNTNKAILRRRNTAVVKPLKRLQKADHRPEKVTGDTKN